jgi:hypothetical protein
MSKERCEELRRQRRVVAEHLGWLDRELAEAEAQTNTVERRDLSSLEVGPIDVLLDEHEPVRFEEPEVGAAVLREANRRADELIARHRAEDRFDPGAAKRGCYLMVFIVLALGLAGLWLVYRFGSGGR